MTGRMRMTGGMLEKAKKVLMAHKLLNGSLTSLQSKNLKRGLGRRRHRIRQSRKMRKHKVHHRRKRRMGGARVSKFLQNANTFLKKHQVLSRVGEYAIPFVPGPYVPLAQTAVGAIRKAGYGARSHKMRGFSRMMGMGRRHRGGMGVLPPAVFNTSTSNIGIPKF
jgi:hypothetical protein